MKARYLTASLALASALFFAACGGEDASKTAPAAQAPMASAPATQVPTSGIVAETVDGDGYTYAQVNSMGSKLWVAGPPVALRVGESVSFKFPSPKSNYRSAALNRTFDLVYFVTEMKPVSAGAMGASPHGSMGGMGGAMGASPHGGAMGGAMGASPHGGAMGGMGQTMPPSKVDLTGIAKANGGYTVAELYQKKGQLAGKGITLRGKVVKVTSGVMGTNWVHVRDGSGADGSNDLTVTCSDTANVGDTVIVSGLLSTDVDIGSGYFFPVIVRDGKLNVERR